MYTFISILKASVVTASLLLAGTAHAGDTSFDRAQAARTAKAAAVENHQATGDAKPAEGRACHCATSAPRSTSEKSLQDDLESTVYRGG